MKRTLLAALVLTLCGCSAWGEPQTATITRIVEGPPGVYYTTIKFADGRLARRRGVWGQPTEIIMAERCVYDGLTCTVGEWR